ncbi:MAG: cell division protein FtsL [Deltaproteobacteria bacterium]|nr:cell division protein FtsL [Deltaproteobacteria bacterium]
MRKWIKNKLFLVLVMVVLSLLYVRARFLTVELSYKVQDLRVKKLELEDEKRKYLLELSTIQSPKRVKEIANEKFDLGYQKKNAKNVYVSE